MQESPHGNHFLPAVLTSFLLFAPIIGGGIAAIAMMLAFQRISSTGAVNLSVLAGPIAAALIWTAAGLVLWLIGLGSFFVLTLKLSYKRVWFWRVAVVSSILLLFSSTIVVALPALLFLVFGRSRLLPGKLD